MNLKQLFIKKAKLKLKIKKKEITIGSEKIELEKIQNEVNTIKKEILINQLPAYYINLQNLQDVLNKSGIAETEKIIESCVKKSELAVEINSKKSEKDINFIDCTLVYGDNRFIIYQDEGEHEGTKARIFIKELE